MQTSGLGQDTADARAQHGHTSSICDLEFMCKVQKQLEGSGGHGKFWSYFRPYHSLDTGVKSLYYFTANLREGDHGGI